MTRYSDDGFTTADGEGPDRVRVRCGACGEAFPSLEAEESHVCTRGRELHRDLDDDGGHELVADGGLPPVEERPVSESEAARRAAQERIVARARDVRTDGGVKQSSVIDHVRERPQIAIYSLCITLFMSSFYHGALDVAVEGGVLLVGTGWYTQFCRETVAETERSADTEGSR